MEIVIFLHIITILFNYKKERFNLSFLSVSISQDILPHTILKKYVLYIYINIVHNCKKKNFFAYNKIKS